MGHGTGQSKETQKAAKYWEYYYRAAVAVFQIRSVVPVYYTAKLPTVLRYEFSATECGAPKLRKGWC